MGLHFKEFKELLANPVYQQIDPNAFEQTVSDLIRHATVFSKATNTAFLITSTLESEIYYISDGLIELTGYTNQELLQIGNQFVRELMKTEENNLLRQISRQAYDEIFKQRSKDKTSYPVSISRFRIKHKLGHWVNLENQSYPICHLNDRSLFVVSYSRKTQDFTRTELNIYYPQEKLKYIYNHTKKKFIKSDKVELNSTEYQILKLTATGHKEYQIEKEMQIDINIIKYYKKKIMSKMSVNSMPEAVYYALKNGIL